MGTQEEIMLEMEFERIGCCCFSHPTESSMIGAGECC